MNIQEKLEVLRRMVGDDEQILIYLIGVIDCSNMSNSLENNLIEFQLRELKL